MARPRRSEQTREALIEEGIRQLAAHGYHGTGIKQILDAVRVPKGSFYNYFDSKETFVAEIVRAYSEQGLGQLDAYLNSGKTLSALDKLKAIYHYILEQHADVGQTQRGCLIGSLAAEIGSSSVVCQHALIEACRGWQHRLTELFREAQQAHQVRDDLSPDEMATLFWSAWEGSLLRMKMEGSVQAPQRMLSLLLDKVFKHE